MAFDSDNNLYVTGLQNATGDDFPIIPSSHLYGSGDDNNVYVTKFSADDGSHDDGAAGDGVYGNRFTDTEFEGSYSVQLRAKGVGRTTGLFTRVDLKSIMLTKSDFYALMLLVEGSGSCTVNPPPGRHLMPAEKTMEIKARPSKGYEFIRWIGPVQNPDSIHTRVVMDRVKTIAAVFDKAILPKQYELSQNFPNPFNPITTIEYALPEPSHVKLELLNIRGEIVDAAHKAGKFTCQIDARDYASGLYLYRIQANDFRNVKKLMVIK